MQVVESPEAAVEALQRRLTAQEQTNESLARAEDKLVDAVKALRKVDSHQEERRVAMSCCQSGDKTKIQEDKQGDSRQHRPQERSGLRRAFLIFR